VHGETQAGTPACAAAILAVIDELERIDVVDSVRTLAADLAGIADSMRADGLITRVTGTGCFLGLHLRTHDGEALSGREVLDVVSAIADHGVQVQPGPSGIGLIPAYGFDAADLLEMDAGVRAGLAQTGSVWR